MNAQPKKENISLADDIAYRTLIEPWITESSTVMMELNKYVFKISPRASKKDVKRSVEGLYKVKVKAVNTVSIPRKFRVQGKNEGWKPGMRKAIVTLKEGDKIDFFEGK